MLNKIETAFTIKDLEGLSGIKAHTIRIWESRYEVLKPKRTGKNFRLYTTEDLKHLLNVVHLYNNGFKISKIIKLSQEEIKEKINALTEAKQESTYINTLKTIVLDFDEAAFNTFFKTLEQEHSHSYIFENIIFPFLNEVGLLWQTSKVRPANEHFISNLVKQKLFTLIDALPLPSSASGQEFVLFLPPNELHELSLLYLQYTLRKKGEKSIYLGQSVPISDLKRFIRLNKNTIFISSSIRFFDEKKWKNLHKELQELNTKNSELLLHLEHFDSSLELDKLQNMGFEFFKSKVQLLNAINKRIDE